MRRVLLATAALVAAVAVFTLITLPPRSLSLAPAWDDGSVRGTLHVHTNRSDGRSSPEAIAAAAARAGLKFVVLTDHGDATREPDPPTYRAGVLCLDGVEISTTGGHYVAIGLPAAPYRLGGEPRDVVADVRRLGGIGIIAHPDSPKDLLRWHDWSVRPDGIEIVNPDTSWRKRIADPAWRQRLSLLSTLFTYPVRAPETIAKLLTPSPELLQRWSAAMADGPLVGIAGSDAHAKLELRAVDPGDNRYSLPIPGYESGFRALSVHVRPAAAFAGDAESDARALLEGIRAGQVFIVVDGWASPAAFTLTAAVTGTSGAGEAAVADGGTLITADPVTLRVRSNAPAGFEVRTLRDNAIVDRRAASADFTWTTDGAPGAYRVEIHRRADSAGPAWLTSNPVYVRRAPVAEPEAPAEPPTSQRHPLFDGKTTSGWGMEPGPRSLIAIDAVQSVPAPSLRVRYGLPGGGGDDNHEYAAAAVDTPADIGHFDRLRFRARAEHDMRVSVQVRVEMAGRRPERWQRSIVLSADDRDYTIPFSDMTPVGEGLPASPTVANIRTVLFVVDTTNTAPGASGRIWITAPELLGR